MFLPAGIQDWSEETKTKPSEISSSISRVISLFLLDSRLCLTTTYAYAATGFRIPASKIDNPGITFVGRPENRVCTNKLIYAPRYVRRWLSCAYRTPCRSR